MSAPPPEIGDTVIAKVTRVLVYGLIMHNRGHEILVQVPEVSWTFVDVDESFEVGEELPVKIIRYRADTQQLIGSLRRARMDLCPYERYVSAIDKEPLTACVVRIRTENHPREAKGSRWAWVHFDDGVRAGVSIAPDAPEIAQGETINVRIKSVDTEEWEMKLEYCARQSS